MGKHTINIQDGFLFQTLKEGTQVVVTLMPGGVLQGRLRRFDRFAIILETPEQEVLIYKHAIATIGPPPAG
ncbi:MAG: RNA chaperone Hfq [Thermoanaerobaculia bacterium]|jgi:RNA chaperone Hfq|nr:RNA chaperone Hfq [Thermoanaerobaculia bacterium]